MMRLINQILLVCFFILLSLICEATIQEIQTVKIERLKLEGCLLPEDHPLHAQLKGLFIDPDMFKSNECLRLAGFHPCNKPLKPFMVATHPKLKHYIIKKYRDDVSQHKQLKNYLDRISASRALRKFIQLNHLQHITVPQKWIYKLPKRFSPKINQKSYILIVEKVDICSGADDLNGEIAQKYKSMNFDILKELCLVLYYFRGLDSSLRNMPFTRQNQIAFIDTEHWQDESRPFLRHVMPYLSPEHQQYALAIYEELSMKDPR